VAIGAASLIGAIAIAFAGPRPARELSAAGAVASMGRTHA
jgi:hypothetical protein